MTDRIRVCRQFAEANGWSGADWKMVAGDASNRKYFRLARGNDSAILMDAPPQKGEDVRPFVHIATYLKKIGLSAPEIFAQDTASGCLLLEDLSDDLFATLLQKDTSEESDFYTAAVDVLVHLHAQRPPEGLARYDADTMAEMAALSVQWYVNRGQCDAAKEVFCNDFRALLAQLDTDTPVLIQRDYHAQNLLWLPDRTGIARVGLLDFQDAMLGHPGYDLVSVLQDARRDVPKTLEDEMVRYFCAKTARDEADFRQAYALLGLQRNLRILGVFARLSLRDGKAHYVDLIPRVWEFIERNLAHSATDPVREMVLRSLPAPSADVLEGLR